MITEWQSFLWWNLYGASPPHVRLDLLWNLLVRRIQILHRLVLSLLGTLLDSLDLLLVLRIAL